MTARLADEALADIQGFVTSGYGHLPSARYVFLEIYDAAAAQRYVAQLLPRITSAAPWPIVNGKKVKPVTAVNVAFTMPALRRWACPTM